MTSTQPTFNRNDVKQRARRRFMREQRKASLADIAYVESLGVVLLSDESTLLAAYDVSAHGKSFALSRIDSAAELAQLINFA